MTTLPAAKARPQCEKKSDVPQGQHENSPTIHRWVRDSQATKSCQGRPSGISTIRLHQ